MKHIKSLTKVDPRMAQLASGKCDTILKSPQEKEAKKGSDSGKEPKNGGA